MLHKKLLDLDFAMINTNFRGANRKGQMKSKLARSIVGVDCGAYLVHVCVQTTADALPAETEVRHCENLQTLSHLCCPSEMTELYDFKGSEY